MVVRPPARSGLWPGTQNTSTRPLARFNRPLARFTNIKTMHCKITHNINTIYAYIYTYIYGCTASGQEHY